MRQYRRTYDLEVNVTPSDEKQLIKIVNSHGSDLATLQCLIVGLFKHVKGTAGVEGVREVIKDALEEARAARPHNANKPDIERIKRLGAIIEEQN